jgi:hypothetical protein
MTHGPAMNRSGSPRPQRNEPTSTGLSGMT